MALTIDDLDALESAIALGAMTVKYTDKEIQYQSFDQMMKAREFLRRKLGLTTGSVGRMNVSTHKGLGDGGNSGDRS